MILLRIFRGYTAWRQRMTNIIEGITLLGEHTGLVIIGCLELLAALFLVLSFFRKKKGSRNRIRNLVVFRLGLVAVVLLLLLLVILIAELLRSLFLWKKTVLKENL